MKKRQILLAAGFILAGCVLSCATNMTEVKKKEEATRNLGEAYMGQGDYTSALREFLKAEQLYPDDPFLQNDLGLTYRAKGKLDLAIGHFKKALELNPKYAAAKNNLGEAYMAKGEWDTAIMYFQQLSVDLLYATPHYPLSNLGWAYYNKNDYAQAEKYYLEALKLEPKYVTALRGLGRTYTAMGKIPEAIDTLEKAIKAAPQFAGSYLDIGKAYAADGHYQKALDAFNKVLELAPESPFAREAKKEADRITGG